MFKAGFARADVTPPLGTILTGYFVDRISDGVLDPIQLNALAVCDGEKTALVITSDFMYISEKSMTRYRSLIADKTGVDANSILIQSVHQHTSTSAGFDGPTSPEYQYILEQKYCDVARMAIDDLAEASVSIAQKKTDVPISFIRRFKMKDGTTKTNPSSKILDEIEGPIGEADNTVRLVKFSRQGAKDIALVNFQTHPDVVHGNKFSADWPGFTRRFCEADLKDAHCILVNGCQGDVNHINPFDKHNGYEHSEFMGRTIADTVIDIWNKTEVIECDKITADVQIKRIPSNMKGIEKIDECIAFYKAYQAGEIEYHSTMGELGEFRRIAEMESVTLVQRVPVSILAFGKVALIGYGGEPFSEYATNPRAAVPELFVLSACLLNGSEGYLPSLSAFEEGGYEARTTNFTESVAPVLQNTATEMLKSHLEK